MKKIVYIIMMVIMCGFVLAQNGNQAGSQNQENTQTQQTTQTQEQAREQNREQTKSMIQARLGESLDKANNQQAKRNIERNMKNFEKHIQTRLHKISDIDILDVNEETGELKIRARERLLFLGLFASELNKEFSVDKEGNVMEQYQWYHQFFN